MAVPGQPGGSRMMGAERLGAPGRALARRSTGGRPLRAGEQDVGTATGVDLAAVFGALPTAYLVMSPDLVIVEANPAYLTLLGRTREELVGQYVFDAFPPAPESLDPDGVNPLQASFERARDTGEPDHMPLFRYEVVDTATGRPVPRAWSLISAPVPDPDGRTQLVLQRVEDVSEYLAERERLAERRDDGGWARLDGLEADLFARTQELQAALASREAATHRLAAMAQVVLQLTSAETVTDVTTVLAGAGLAAIGADGGGVALRDDEREVVELSLTPSLGAGAQRRFRTIELTSRLPAAWAARTGETVVLGTRAEAEAWSPQMREAHEQSGQSAWIAVPLTCGGRLLGSLLAGWTDERAFSADQVDLVQAFAAQCAQALDRAQSLTRERRSAEHSRLLAEELQRSMLTEPFQPDHCQIAVRYLPATRAASVGGDWYDAFLQLDGAVNLVIGDVVGHDTGAAAAMGQLRSLLRGIAVTGDAGPAQVLDALDTAIVQLGLDTYATVGMGRLEQDPAEVDRGVTRLRWTSAGHPAPVVLGTDGELVEVPEVPGRLMLGVDRGRRRGETVVELPRGATVLLYTDGLVERPGAHLDEGLAYLAERVQDAPADPERLCDHLLRSLVPGHGAPDDVALLALQNTPMADRFSIALPAEPEALASMRALVRRWLRHAEGSEQEVAEITTACGEAATNAVEHAAASGSRPFEVDGVVRGREVEITVRDHGAWRPPRDGDQGRGLSLMRALMDAVDVTPTSEGTIVRLRRVLDGRGPE
jgi:PAS domain S-box-containing protein